MIEVQEIVKDETQDTNWRKVSNSVVPVIIDWYSVRINGVVFEGRSDEYFEAFKKEKMWNKLKSD